MKARQRLGLVEDTSVSFTCDHGKFTGAHRLHDKDPAMYEDIYRTPGLRRIPGRAAGVVREEFVSLQDCTATVLDLVGRLHYDPSMSGLDESTYHRLSKKERP